MQGASIATKGSTEKKDKAVSQTSAERRFKQKPYLSCDLRFSTRTIIFLSIYLQKNSNDVAFSPLRWVRLRPHLPLSRFVMPCVWVCYAIDGRQRNSRGMCLSVLLPERLAGWMRLRWSCRNDQCKSLNDCTLYRAKDSLLKNAFIMKG